MNDRLGSSEIDLTPNDDIDLSINGYRLIREVNQGGQAIVFLAVQESTGRKVALKLIPGGPLASSRERGLMDKEVRILAALDHPNIVSVVDKGKTADGSSYFVLEYVHGQNLSEFVDGYYKRFPRPSCSIDRTDLIRMFIRICEAVNAAHLRGIVHRDLKPDNIIIDAHSEPHILDFGLARPPLPTKEEEDDPMLRISGQFVGSLQWASPEQAEGVMSKMDIRSDVYSLGVILYEMLTGEFPYDVFGTLTEVLNHIVHTVPDPPSRLLRIQWESLPGDVRRKAGKKLINPIHPDLDAIVMKALAKSREDRFQSAGELARALNGCLAGLRWTKPSPAMIARWTVGAALLAALATAGATIWFYSDRIGPKGEYANPIALALPEGTFGYRVEGEEVVFVFDPLDYNVVRLANGQLGELSAIPQISSVHVAGQFNQWIAGDPEWELQRVGPLRYELRVPLERMAERSRWIFKYVVNGTIWVSAPRNASNKEIVIEDTATYNLIFRNPSAVPTAFATDFRAYQAQIEASLPGHSGDLAVDENGGLHFSFSQLPTYLMRADLAMLKDIPLTSLDLTVSRATDLHSLAGMTTLTRLILPDATYRFVMDGYLRHLRNGQYDAARNELDILISGLEDVPAFASFHQIHLEGVRIVQALASFAQSIPYDARPYRGRHYAWIPIPLKWWEARRYAENHGAILSTVRDAEHQNWLVEQFGIPSAGRTFWLGGTDELYEGLWGWLSADPWDFENWTGQEPNNQDGVENALAMGWNGWWYDYNGDVAELPFLMEWMADPADRPALIDDGTSLDAFPDSD